MSAGKQRACKKARTYDHESKEGGSSLGVEAVSTRSINRLSKEYMSFLFFHLAVLLYQYDTETKILETKKNESSDKHTRIYMYVQLQRYSPNKTHNSTKLEPQRDAPRLTDRGYARSSFGINIYSSANFLLLGVGPLVASVGLQQRPEFGSMHAVATRMWQLYVDQYHRPTNDDLGLWLINPSPGFASGTNPTPIINPYAHSPWRSEWVPYAGWSQT